MDKKIDYKNVLKVITTIVIIIVPALVFGYMGKTVEMGLMIVASAITVTFLNIDQVQHFKGAGFEAEMKKAVDEAYATIEALKEVSKPTIVATLNEINWSGRFGGLDIKQKHILKNDIECVINKFEFKDKQITDALEEFYRYNTWDFLNNFIKEIVENPQVTDEQSNNLRLTLNYKSNNFLSKEHILDIIKIDEKNLKTDELKKLNDYLYYKEKHELP